MNVTGAVLDGLEQDQIDEANNGGFVGEVGHAGGILGGGDLADFSGDLLVFAQLLENVRDLFGVFRIILVDGLFDLDRVGDDQLNLFFDDEPQFIDAGGIEGVNQS